MNICSPSVGPYSGVYYDRKCEKGGHKFRLVAYRSFNAYGLYGSEYNGIAVLSETDMAVVCDNYFQSLSAYSANERRVIAEINRMIAMSAEDFIDLVKDSPRTRYIPELSVTA